MKKSLTAFMLTLSAIFASAQVPLPQPPDQAPAPALEDGPIVEIKTSLGDITVLLYNDTPLHRDNFLKLVKEGFYDGVLFHRVIQDFMVQAGDPNSRNAAPEAMLGDGGPRYTIPAEFNYPKRFHKYGALAAAREGDATNPERASSASQFYIVKGRKYSPTQLAAQDARRTERAREARWRQMLTERKDEIEALQATNDSAAIEKRRDELVEILFKEIPDMKTPDNIAAVYEKIGGTPHLDGTYTVFGEVLTGMETVEKIEAVETNKNDRPLEDVRIISMKILREK